MSCVSYKSVDFCVMLCYVLYDIYDMSKGDKKMDLEIMILNKMTYEKEGKEKSRLGYFVIGEKGFSDNEKFKGYSDLSAFADDKRFFDLVPNEFIGQKCIAKIVDRPNPRNPMRMNREISEITCNGKTIYLV